MKLPRKGIAANRARAIDRIKNRVRKAAIYINRNTAHLDCGLSLACEFRPGLRPQIRIYDNGMDRLRRIDPDFPKVDRR